MGCHVAVKRRSEGGQCRKSAARGSRETRLRVKKKKKKKIGTNILHDMVKRNITVIIQLEKVFEKKKEEKQHSITRLRKRKMLY